MSTTPLTEQQRRTAAVLLAEHGPALWRIAIVVAGSRQDAEDLLATAVLRALPHLDRTDLQVPAYLRRVMLNLRAAEWRRHKDMVTSTADGAGESSAGDAFEDQSVLRIDLAAALERLGPRQRAVVALRYLEDLDVAETARILGCSPETVRSQAHRALARLRSEVPALFSDHSPDTAIARKGHHDDDR